MLWKNYKNYTGLKHTFILLPVVLIFTLALTACPSQVPHHQNLNDRLRGPGEPQPTWTITEYIFHNRTNSQISISGDSRFGSVFLHINECVYIEDANWLMFMRISMVKAGKRQLCESSECADKRRKALQRYNSFGDFKRDNRSTVPYLEFYDIVDTNEIFEIIRSPASATSAQKDHWMRQCKPLSSPPIKR